MVESDIAVVGENTKRDLDQPKQTLPFTDEIEAQRRKTLAGDHKTAVLEIQLKRTWKRKEENNANDQRPGVLQCAVLFF